MTMHRRRVWAIVRKESREYRRNRSIVVTMAIIPLLFSVQPLVAVLSLAHSEALAHEHVLLYMLGIPTLVPLFVAAYAVAGERAQGSLEPVLTTPIPREEFLLAKAVAAFVPSLIVSYAVFAVFLGIVAVFAHPGVAADVMQGSDLLVQVVFTPLLAGWSIWVAIGVSTRATDVRVAQQLSLLASIPTVLVIVLFALNVIAPSVSLAVTIATGAAALLVMLNLAGWRVTSRLFDRERLITSTR
ncbi:MAG TPA: ABC transporter permease [Candidatus Sulfotelmatobacter sp.]|nr:ABC transporter permease [Candidatus Sulfotelmatobacter sp.]